VTVGGGGWAIVAKYLIISCSSVKSEMMLSINEKCA
jgi:hypothetical protein